jgi:hypothetical protein
MILLVSSALKPSLLVFSCIKRHEMVKQHSFRKGRIRLFKCVLLKYISLYMRYAKQTKRKKPHVYCLQWIWRKFSWSLNISNDPLEYSENDWLIAKQLIVFCVVKSIWCFENNNCHLGNWMQCHFQVIVTLLRNNLITFISVEAVGI